jgi:hypothetical protein
MRLLFLIVSLPCCGLTESRKFSSSVCRLVLHFFVGIGAIVRPPRSPPAGFYSAMTG